ncbi:MAG TPA: hypothetical protein VFZ61_03615 [Polyangiales bacterium]
MRPILLALLALIGGPTAYTLIPPEQQPLVEHILATMGAIGVVLAAVRPALNLLPSSRFRWFVEGVDWFLDVLASNTTPLKSRIPGKKSVPPGPPFGFVLMLALPLLLSCTPHAAARMRGALDVLRSIQTPAQEIAERACTAQHGQDAPQCATVHDVFESVRVLREEAEKLAPPDDAGTDAAP